MKKTISLITAIIVIAGLGWYSYQLIQNKGKSDTELIEFAVKDIESIDKIIINDPTGASFEVVKKDAIWTDKNGGCITQGSVEFLLDAFKNIEFKGYLPENSIDTYLTKMISQNTEVQIYQNGEWAKTWYLGPSAQDHYGQIMLLDDKKYGKSDFPVVMKIKGVNGIIEPRFFADARKWMCSNIFALSINKISKIDMKFLDEPERSFTVSKNGNDMKVYQQGKLLHDVDTSMIFRYLNNYKKIHFDVANYDLSEKEVDSVKATTPFGILEVSETNGSKTTLKCFRMPLKEATPEGIVIYEDNDKNKFWCELPNGELVKCQYFVFNPLFLGHIYFPMDISMLETVDGLIKK